MASRSWNRVELIGNLTRDPELRFTSTGTAVCTIGIATNRTYVVDGERKEEVDFHRIVAWNKLAELCNQLLKKGLRVFISGRLQYREWETQDGQKRRDAEIVLEDMILLSPKDVSVMEHTDLEEVAPTQASPAEAPAVQESTVPVKKEPVEKIEKAAADETVSADDLPF